MKIRALLLVALVSTSVACWNVNRSQNITADNRFEVATGSLVLGARQLLVDTSNGDVIVPFSAVNIPGMNIQEYRIGFRGRTGGAWNKQEVSNVVITEDALAPVTVYFGVPEPASFTLLGLASVMLLALRRRK